MPISCFISLYRISTPPQSQQRKRGHSSVHRPSPHLISLVSFGLQQLLPFQSPSPVLQTHLRQRFGKFRPQKSWLGLASLWIVGMTSFKKDRVCLNLPSQKICVYHIKRTEWAKRWQYMLTIRKGQVFLLVKTWSFWPNPATHLSHLFDKTAGFDSTLLKWLPSLKLT